METGTDQSIDKYTGSRADRIYCSGPEMIERIGKQNGAQEMLKFVGLELCLGTFREADLGICIEYQA